MPKYYYLTPVLGGPGAPRYPVTDRRQIIGRSEESEIALLEPTVSRRHAGVEFKEDQVWLEDLQSKHGSFVNSKRINKAQLKEGDIVVFGLSIVLRLEQTDQEVPPAMPLRVPGGLSLNHPFAPLRAVEGSHTAELPHPVADRETAMHRVVPSDLKQAREIIRLKDQLVKARKMSAAGTFCMSVIPDIHQRVESVYRVLDDPTAVDPAALRQSLELVLKSLTRIMEATQVIPAPLKEPTNLADAIKRAVDVVQPDMGIHRIQLDVRVPEGLAALTDPQRLVVALSEFIKSAIRSGRSGATVTITGTQEGEEVLLTISNQSQEISADGLIRVFDPFVTSDVHWQRLGLGIFEARQIVMSFGGTVTLESAEGLGTSVDICLPTSD